MRKLAMCFMHFKIKIKEGNIFVFAKNLPNTKILYTRDSKSLGMIL
jgi:hypothetical protein